MKETEDGHAGETERATAERLRDDNRRLRSLLTEANAELANLRGQNGVMELASSTADRQAQEAYLQLNLVRQSLSWRLTEPLRAFKQALRF